MSKICQQILLTEDNYQWLIEEKIGRRHKNLSQTINELLINYKIMVRSIAKTAQETNILDKKLEKQAETVQSYRKQIIDNNKTEQEITNFMQDVRKAKSLKEK